jgi:hypothetical protein
MSRPWIATIAACPSMPRRGAGCTLWPPASSACSPPRRPDDTEWLATNSRAARPPASCGGPTTVYGFTEDAADMFSFEGWAAQWLALRPDDDVERRRADPDCIISHDSAAVIRELGTIVARGLFLTGPRRINTRSAHVHTYRRDIGARGVDWDVVEGLPVATPGRIIADLARDDVDGAHQGTVIADVLNSGLLTLDEVGARLDPFAHRWDEPSGTSLALRFSAAAERPLHLPA